MESAGQKAQEVVGLYGDPDTTWGICLELGLDDAIDLDAARARLAALVSAYPHLGPVPDLVEVAPEDWDHVREPAARDRYAVGEALVRVLIDNQDRRIFVAAHHGVCDGLGLLAVAGAVCGVPIAARARGIGDRPAQYSFLGSSLRRVFEALLSPPPRFAPGSEQASPDEVGEHLVVRRAARINSGSADLAAAAAQVFLTWNPPARRARWPLLVAGASRRPAGTLAPDRQTAYLRLRVDPSWSRNRVRQAFAEVTPEPEFPETSAAGIGPRVTRLLRSRLGGTAQLSNLGVIDAPGISYAAMFPALSGPRAVAIGMVSTASETTISLRTRACEFTGVDTGRLADLLQASLREGRGPRSQ